MKWHEKWLETDLYEGIPRLFHGSPNKIGIIKWRRVTWAEHAAHMGEKKNAYKFLVGKLDGKRPLEGLYRKRKDNIKVDFK